MMAKRVASSTNKNTVAFAKARYEYCYQLYKAEQERKEILEKKAQFYLSLVTLFLGALVLNIDFIIKIVDFLQRNPLSQQQTTALYIAVSVFVLSLIVTLITILISVHVRGYLIEHPADLTSALFNSASEYIPSNTEAEFYTSTARSYALATESDRISNARKSEWVRLSSFFLFIALLSFIFIYGVVIYFELN